MVRASIAMAVYNGERFLDEQIRSILDMMSDDDELVISYNESSDNSLEILKRFENKDSRIHVHFCREMGVAKNFQNAVEHCRGKYIFYSDQDDIWLDDKINFCVKELKNSGKSMLLHDGYSVDEGMMKIKGTLFNGKKIKVDPISVWIGEKAMGGKSLGCCMVIDRQYIPAVIPFPDNSHDVWTINILSRIGGVHVVNNKLIKHRIHDRNVSPLHRRKIYIVFGTRVLLFIKLFVREIKYISSKR